MIKCNKNKQVKLGSVSLHVKTKGIQEALGGVEPLAPLHGGVPAAGAQQLLLVLGHQAVEAVAVPPPARRLLALLRRWAFLRSRSREI